MWVSQGAFCVCAQPMRGDVTLWHHLSMAWHIHKMIPEGCLSTHPPPSGTYIYIFVSEIGKHWFRQWLVARTELSDAGILLIGALETNFSQILMEIITFSFKKKHFKVSSAKWWPSCCLCLNVLRHLWWKMHITPESYEKIWKENFLLSGIHSLV